MRILIVDDESEIRKILTILLENSGYEVVSAADGLSAVMTLKNNSEIDLCIMDVMMPRMDGLQACAEIRRFSSIPILFLTAKSLDEDKEMAYSGGGDDYLVKPFSSKELLMKVEALIRRYTSYKTKPQHLGEEIRLNNGVVVSPDARQVYKNGVLLDIRDKEMELLIYLAKNRGRVISASELYEKIWDEKALSTSNNTVTVHMLGLRRKMEDNPSQPKIIRTVWGKGYQID
jgi:DNA-binding response OmpR family regulator